MVRPTAEQTLRAPIAHDIIITSAQRAKRAMLVHRRCEVVTRWLLLLLAAWVTALMGPDSWKIGAWVLVTASFGRLVLCELPLGRDGRVALGLCVLASGAMLVLTVFPLLADAGSSRASGVLALLVIAVGGIGSVVAFGTFMRALARLGGSTASMRQWQSVQRWQLAMVIIAVLVVFAIAWPFDLTQPKSYKSDSAPLGLLMIGGLGLVFVSFVVYPAVAIVRLVRHLRWRFDLWGLVERGDLDLEAREPGR